MFTYISVVTLPPTQVGAAPRLQVAKQPARLRDDHFGRCPDKPHIAAGNAFRPLGLLTQHKQRHAQGRRFFLDSSGIAEDQVRVAHPNQQLVVSAGRD
jgi:hypothetical protein